MDLYGVWMGISMEYFSGELRLSCPVIKGLFPCVLPCFLVIFQWTPADQAEGKGRWILSEVHETELIVFIYTYFAKPVQESVFINFLSDFSLNTL